MRDRRANLLHSDSTGPISRRTVDSAGRHHILIRWDDLGVIRILNGCHMAPLDVSWI